MSQWVSYRLDEQVAHISIDNGKVNALSPDVFAALNEALDKAEEEARVVVLTGKPGMFSGGYDLKVMQQGMEQALSLVETGSRLTRRMLAFKRPIIAACNGHAMAKGAFLLLASDYRLGVAGDFKISLNEVAIGMTMHHVGIELCKGRLSQPFVNRAMINAEVFDPELAISAGFLDATVGSEDELQTQAMLIAKHMCTLNEAAFAATKVKANQAQLDALDLAIDLDRGAKS